jgi:hypothetical protein
VALIQRLHVAPIRVSVLLLAGAQPLHVVAGADLTHLFWAACLAALRREQLMNRQDREMRKYRAPSQAAARGGGLSTFYLEEDDEEHGEDDDAPAGGERARHSLSRGRRVDEREEVAAPLGPPGLGSLVFGAATHAVATLGRWVS